MKHASILTSLLLLPAGCHTVELDLSAIKQPIMLAGGPQRRPTGEVITKFASTVSYVELAAGDDRNASGFSRKDNPVQLDAFELLGGRPSRCIENVAVRFHSLSTFALLLISESMKIQVKGDVYEYETHGHP